MKILIIGNKVRYEQFNPHLVNDVELVYADLKSTEEQLIKFGQGCQVILVDAIGKVSENVINQLSDLKMIHSEGVGFDGIDLQAAKVKHIYVCNNQGCNAAAVGEQTILLMLALHRNVIVGDWGVRAGKQIQMKEAAMINGIKELSQSHVGLIGFGDIAKAVAKFLHAFGAQVSYYAPHRKELAIEQEYHVTYLELDDLLGCCDMVSLHCTLNPSTVNMVDDNFIEKMQDGAILINTSRGALVDNLAVRVALLKGKLGGLGLDTIYPEPTLANNPLVDLPKEVSDKVIYSPHLGGITTGSMQRCHEHCWKNVQKIVLGQRPDNIVNGL